MDIGLFKFTCILYSRASKRRFLKIYSIHHKRLHVKDYMSKTTPQRLHIKDYTLKSARRILDELYFKILFREKKLIDEKVQQTQKKLNFCQLLIS